MSNKLTRTINGVVYLDETRLWKEVSTKETPLPRRLSEIMRLAGVRFYDEEPDGYNFVRQPLVAVTGFGGFPVSFDDTTPEGHLIVNSAVRTPAEILGEFQNTMGRAGFYSYLNPGNLSADAMDAVTTQHGHFSKAHTVVLDLAVLGYSAAIEGNEMILRRWFNHVGRLTNTRCQAQSDPPLVVMEPEDLADAQAARSAIAAVRSKLKPPVRGEIGEAEHRERVADFYERVNAYWPNSRALILMVNADLANLRGTMPDIADKGQELEQRRLLSMMNDLFRRLYPVMFKHSSAYGYEMPAHWPDRMVWELERAAFQASVNSSK